MKKYNINENYYLQVPPAGGTPTQQIQSPAMQLHSPMAGNQGPPQAPYGIQGMPPMGIMGGPPQ